MRRLTRTMATLAVAATPVLGVIAAVHPDGFLADNGVISTNNTGGSGSLHARADGGVISTNNTGGSGSMRILADDGIVNSRN